MAEGGRGSGNNLGDGRPISIRRGPRLGGRAADSPAARIRAGASVGVSATHFRQIDESSLVSRAANQRTGPGQLTAMEAFAANVP